MDEEKQDIANFTGLNLDDVRTFKIGDKIHFDAMALCKILKIKNPTAALRKIPENNLRTVTVDGEDVLVVNEGGLYLLMFKSDSPAANKFNDWIFDRVVPEIVETGGYNVGKKIVN